MKKNKRSCVIRALIILGIICSMTIRSVGELGGTTQSVREQSWLTGWVYRKSHTIRGSSAGFQTNYSMSIKVHYGSGVDVREEVYLNSQCRPDFGDIRFTRSDGQTELDYWLEEKVDMNYAIFWVAITEIPTTSTFLYIYYGNSGASTSSDGDYTFLFFDDFNDNSLDPSKWNTNTDDNGNSVSETGGQLKICKRGYVYSKIQFNDPIVLEFKAAATFEEENFLWGISRFDGGVSSYRLPYSGIAVEHHGFCGWYIRKHVNGRFSPWYGLAETCLAENCVVPNSKYNIKLMDGKASYNTKFYINGTELFNLTIFETFATNYVSPGIGHDKLDFYIYFDDFRVRPYVDPEPSHGGWGSEEVVETPTVIIVNPNGEESWYDLQTITWTATDPQGDPLTYTVFYSPNGGQTWIQLTAELIESSYLWDTTTVVDGTNYLIRVEASGGLYTGKDVSDAPFEIVNEPTPPIPSEVGRIVVLADDLPTSDSHWSISATKFTLNTFSWLTEFSGAKRILIDASHFDDMLKSRNLKNTLQTNGYFVTISDTTNWITRISLENYDAVLVEQGSIDTTTLTEYVNGGGGVCLIGGHSGSELKYNEFLLNFGMSLQEPVNPGYVTLTSFVPHPVTTGISALETLNPTPIVVHSSEPTILATWGGWNWLATYSKEVPVWPPTVTVVRPNGGEAWQAMQTITWTAIDPQDDPLTYTVYYSPNGGQTWTRLATGLTESSYLWDTTTIFNGINYLIRVEATDGTHSGVDVSDSPFEIANELMNTAPTVQVIRPNGGERVHGTFEIQWSANDPNGDPLTFTLSYSPNAGQIWTQIANGVTGTSYQWDTSGVQVGENYLVKIEASDGRLTAEDRSDYKFTVEREATTEMHSEAFFVPSFRVIEALGALLVLLGFGEINRRRKM